MLKPICLFGLLFLRITLSGQVILAEIAPTNTTQLQDADGDFPDWIELYNSGASSVNLEGMSLSDEPSPKWKFPAYSLGPGQRFIVFASGKNRGALGGPSVDHWETAVNEGDEWHTFVGTEAPPANWADVDFDENTWTAAPGSFGYGDGDDATEVPEGTLAFYYRISFSVVDPGVLDSAILSMDYDDGFIAYLNGTEIARSGNMPPGPADYTTVTTIDHEAQLYTGGDPEAFSISNTRLENLLVPGNNVLAIEIHNVEPASSDLSGRTWLHFGIHTTDAYYGPNPPFFSPDGPGSGFFHTNFKLGYGESLYLFNATGVETEHADLPYLQPGHALMRIDDIGDWCITSASTPDAPNGNSCAPGYAGIPVISPAAGFYSEAQEVIITGNNVRYTLDGSDPDENATLYTGPFTIDATSVVKARMFEPGFLPGNVVAASYFINEPTTLPVLSIMAAPGDLFNDGSGGPAVYDNYQSGLRAAAHLEYFEADKQLIFSEKASVRPVGGYSIAFDQKSMQFAFDEDFGAADEVHYPVFWKDKPGITSLREFRVRNMDDDWASTRMRDVVANRLAMPTHCAATGYQHMAVFINGQYWGHYGGREVTNEYYVRDNHGADEDEVDQILTSYFEDEDYLVDEGSGDDFFDMSDFVIGNDMSDPDLYAQAIKRVDWENWVDYFAAEMYLANGDWFSSMYFNNTRMYHAPDVRWRYILFDVTYAQNHGVSASTNILAEALGNPAYPNRYTDMMNSLLGNPGFHQYFINRFADLMNVYFTTDRALEIINDNVIEIAPEIERQSERWGSVSTLDWISEVAWLKDFHQDRPFYQREQIQEYFGLNGQAEVTLEVQPEGAGVIKISTIIPDTYPWSGIYFDGNPVQITAIPNPGYSFDHWATTLPVDPQQASLELNFSEASSLTAHFAGAAQPTQLEISEINYHSDLSTDAGDWFEIRNTSSIDLDLSDFTIQDSNWFNSFIIPTGTILSPNQYLVIAEEEDLFSAVYPAVINRVGSLGFGLDNNGDAIRILDRDQAIVQDMTYSDASSWPCTPDGFGRTLERFPGLNDPNEPGSWFDGCMSGSPGDAFSPCIDDIIVSEINYHSADDHDAGDWFEVKNQLDVPILLTGWTIKDDNDEHSYTIPEDTWLPENGYFIFCENADAFHGQFPQVTTYAGDFGFGLGNGGDVIRLYDAAGVVRMSVCYGDSTPWVQGPDGNGFTLELSDPYVSLNDPFNWFEGCAGGSPGTAYDPLCGMVGVRPVGSKTLMTLSPNPAAEDAVVTFNHEVSGIIRMMDGEGRLVLEKQIAGYSTSLDIQSLARGVYFLSCEMEDGISMTRLCKL